MSDRTDRNVRKRTKDHELDAVNDEIMQTSPAQPIIDAELVDLASKRIKRVKVWLFIGEVPMYRLLKTAESYGMATGLLYRINGESQVKSLETAQRIAQGHIEFGADFRNFTILCASHPNKTKSKSIIDSIIATADMIIAVKDKEYPTVIAAEEINDVFPVTQK